MSTYVRIRTTAFPRSERREEIAARGRVARRLELALNDPEMRLWAVDVQGLGRMIVYEDEFDDTTWDRGDNPASCS